MELSNIDPTYDYDIGTLKKYLEFFAINYSYSVCLNKYLGSNSGGGGASFIWTDSFSKAKVDYSSFAYDMMCSKYNYGVCLVKLGCKMPLVDNYGIELAKRYMA